MVYLVNSTFNRQSSLRILFQNIQVACILIDRKNPTFLRKYYQTLIREEQTNTRNFQKCYIHVLSE